MSMGPGSGQTEVWCFVIFWTLGFTGHAWTQGSQWVNWWLLAIVGLDESLGMASVVFRLLWCYIWK